MKTPVSLLKNVRTPWVSILTVSRPMSHYFNSAISAFLKVTLVLSFCAFAHAAEYTSVPTLQGRVTDLANVLSVQDRERLSKMLTAYEQETQHQLAVLIVSTLSGETIESFSLRVANTWKLGYKGVNNGILVTLAITDRKTRIELGLGMEPYISNATASSIISSAMIPAFRRGDYAGGIDAGLIELMKEGRKFVVPVSKKTRRRNITANPSFNSDWRDKAAPAG